MSEFQGLTPREATTGLLHKPCLVFGNGVEIETVVYAKTTQESTRRSVDGRTIMILPQRLGENLEGTDIVKVHFLPKTSLAERANEPELVPEDEKNQIRRDCLEGFMLMAETIKNDGVVIQGHEEGDYYLFADTNQQFAAFLKKRCGFRGSDGANQVWIKKSEFVSEENLMRMKEFYETIK